MNISIPPETARRAGITLDEEGRADADSLARIMTAFKKAERRHND